MQLARQTRDAFLRILWRRETGLPEVERFENKSHTTGVEIALSANFTDDANVRLAIGFGRTENQFLLGNQFVAGQDAGSMEANNHGFGLFGEHPTFGIAADDEDGNRNRDASGATDLLVTSSGNLGKGPRVHPQTMLAKKRVMAREM